MEGMEAGFKSSLKSWHSAFKRTAPRNYPHQKPIIILSLLHFIPPSSPRGCSFQTHPDIPEGFRPEQFHPALCTGGKYSPLQPQYSMPRLLGQLHMAHDSRLLFTPQHHSDIITAQEHWNSRNTRLLLDPPWHLRHSVAWLQLEGSDKHWVTQAVLETQCTRNKSSWNFREFQSALLISFEEPCTMANIGLGWFMWLNSPFQRASGGTSEPGEGQTRQRAWGTVLH